MVYDRSPANHCILPQKQYFSYFFRNGWRVADNSALHCAFNMMTSTLEATLDAMLPAIAVALLTPLYGYFFKILAMQLD